MWDGAGGEQVVVSSDWNSSWGWNFFYRGQLGFDFGNGRTYSGLNLTAHSTNLIVVMVDSSGSTFNGDRSRMAIWNGSMWTTADSTGWSSPKLQGIEIGSFNTGREWDGTIDDVRIYDHTLSQLELQVMIGDMTPPAAPANLTAASTGADSVLLHWDDNSEIDLGSYTLYRGTATGGPYTRVASNLIVSGYADSELSAGTPYFYVVTALDLLTNESAPSTEATATPAADTTAPKTPTNLTATAMSHSTILLDWDDNIEGDLGGYTVYRGVVPGGPYAPIASNLTSSTFADSGLSHSTPYHYVASAYDWSHNESDPSGEASATTGPLPPADLVLWWNIEEGTGTNTTEGVSGLPNVASLHGSVVWADGLAPGSDKAVLVRNTIPASYVDVGTLKGDGTYLPGSQAGALMLRDNWTVTAWVKLTGPQGQTSLRAILSSDWGNGGGDFMLQLDGANNEVMSETGGNHRYYSGIHLTTGQVYMVAWQTDTSETILGAGVQSRHSVWDGTGWTTTDYTTGRWLETHGLELGSFNASRQFEGVIDDVRIYTKTLSDDELNELLQLPPLRPSGLMLLIR